MNTKHVTLELVGKDRLTQLETVIERSLQSFIEVGSALLEIRDSKLYRSQYDTFEAYCRDRWQMSRSYAHRLTEAATVVNNLLPIGNIQPTRESQVRPLTKLKAEEQCQAWQLATTISSQPTEAIVRRAVEQIREIGSIERSNKSSIATFNEVNANIGWAKWSWNPVTGCLHDCEYCYARDYANRFYTEKFKPTFHPERLEAPANTQLPANADGDPAWRRVFTCSMADLFGKWVPQEWIKAVFQAIEAHDEWEYLCLTKFPQRLAELKWPGSVWAGTTVDKQARVENAEKSFAKVKAGVKWLSCEPLLEPLKFSSLAMFDWVVIGASTGSTLAEPFAPQFEWVADLYTQAKKAGCRVYLKHNLFGSDEGRGPGMQAIHEWPR